jgi:DNA-binding transcriptional LysR family regulator
VFARVVQAGSFTTASVKLGMPKSTVSRKVSEPEERLNARLLEWTTRKLSLTDGGRTHYDYCARIVGEVEDPERAVSSLQDTPRGASRSTIFDPTSLVVCAIRQERSPQSSSAFRTDACSANFPIRATDTASRLPPIGSVQR